MPHVVPDEWKPRLRAYLLATFGVERERLSASDFSTQTVQLQFEDGSFAQFRYAFVVFDDLGEQCMVFTEHCGYHVFPINTDGVKVLPTS